MNEIKEKTKLKKELMNLAHDLRMKEMKHDFNKKVGIMSFRELILREEVDTKELKQLWKNGKQKN